MKSKSAISPRQAILEVLIRGENYGLGIKRAVAERSSLSLGAGTLYPALQSLERQGLVTSRLEEGGSARGGRPKRFYRLTGEGQAEALESRTEIIGFFGGEVEYG